MKTTKYNDGTAIPLVTDGAAWAALSTPGYFWYPSNPSLVNNPYGALYNWYAVNTGKLCPTGWHVPSDAEWTTLTTYLGGESYAGGKLKEEGYAHWTNPNEGATNESGFTALPGGFRYNNGTFYYIGNYAYWWSSTEDGTDLVWIRIMAYDNHDVSRGYDDKRSGFSVRCMKDN